MSTIPLPALSVRPPEQQDPLSGIKSALAIKGAQQQQQLQVGQQQLQKQQIQEGQIKLAQTKALNDSYKNALTTDANGNPSFDRQKVIQSVTAAGQGSLIPQLNESFLQLDKLGGEVQKAKDDHNEKAQEYFAAGAKIIKSMNYDPSAVGTFLAHATANGYAKEAQQFGQQLSQDPSKIQPIVDSILSSSPKQTEASKNVAQTQEAQATTAEKQQTAAFYQRNPSAGAPGVPAETVSMMDYMRSVPGASPAKFQAWKAQQEAKATQPYKIQTAEAEGRARQLIEGMEKPVYAIGADGQKSLMSATEALQKGIKTMLPVNEGQVTNDIQLNNRLGDVRQKLKEYENAMQTTLGEKDKSNIAALLGTQGAKLGAFGTQVPLDRVNAALDAENIKNLSPQARDAIIAYRNVRESLLGYNKVLSGGSRSSDKQFELNDQTIPAPSITDPDFTKRSIVAFRQNLGVVGQGLPRIPGIKSPEEIEQQVSQQQPEQPKSSDFFSQFGGKPR